MKTIILFLCGLTFTYSQNLFLGLKPSFSNIYNHSTGKYNRIVGIGLQSYLQFDRHRFYLNGTRSEEILELVNEFSAGNEKPLQYLNSISLFYTYRVDKKTTNLLLGIDRSDAVLHGEILSDYPIGYLKTREINYKAIELKEYSLLLGVLIDMGKPKDSEAMQQFSIVYKIGSSINRLSLDISFNVELKYRKEK